MERELVSSTPGGAHMGAHVDVTRWLEEIGLQQYCESFRANNIDQHVLRLLTDSDLKELGVSSLGHRKRIMAAVASLPVQPWDKSPTLSTPEAERRQITVMFCDLVGSTSLAERLDPEDLRNVVRKYHTCCADIVGRFGGSVAQYLGDGIMVRFGYPRAHEDDAERAIRCGLEITKAGAGLETP